MEHLVMLVFLEYLNYNLSMLLAKSWVITSRVLVLWISKVLIFLIDIMSSLTNQDSLSLFLIKVHFFVWIHSSRIGILMEIGVWLDNSLQFRWIWWLSSSEEFGWRKMRSMTESVSQGLSEYLVEMFSIGLEISKPKECYNWCLVETTWTWAKGMTTMIGCAEVVSVSASCSRCYNLT